MKIHLLIAGLARSLDDCLPAVKRKISWQLKLLPGCGFSESLALSYSTNPLDNERTGENQPALIRPETVDSFQAQLFDLEDVRDESREIYERAHKRGEWLEGSGRNLRNYLEFLTVLKKAGESVQESDADIIMFIRPDLLVLDRFVPIPGLTLSTKTVLTPRWGRFLGLNDRFAIVPRQYVSDYFYRIDTVDEFLEREGPLDPERHLAWSLRDIPTRASLGIELVRVRAGGFLADKDLERLETSGPLRRMQARRLRQAFPSR